MPGTLMVSRTQQNDKGLEVVTNGGRSKRIDTGHLKSALTTMRRRLSAYSSWNESFKIGITGDPESRARSYRGQYDKMIVLYETSSRSKIKMMEATLVDEYREYCDNSIGGGGGAVGGPRYYLYIVV